MMPSVPRLLAFLSVPALLTALAGGAAGQAPTPLERAENALNQARDELAAAQDALQALVEDLRDDYVALTVDPEAPVARNRLVLDMLDALPSAEARFAALTAEGRRPSRATRARILGEVLGEAVAADPAVHPRLGGWIASRVAEGLAGRATLADVDGPVLLREIDQLFLPDESWYQFWNRSFHADLPESRLHDAAQKAYEDAGLALDQLRNPERYGPRGEPAPPGMVIVPGGAYELGPNAGFKRPMRKVVLQPFALDRREVTRREYKRFLDAQPPASRRELLPRGWSLGDDGLARDDGAAADPTLSEHPVVFVDWRRAAAYAAWAGKRLPTEDEWEAAAAGPQGLAFPWGDGFEPQRVNGAGAHTGTLRVESYPQSPSAAGCFDMAGNVWEWTATLEDGRDIDALPEGPVNAIIRGGGFDSSRFELATRYRWIAPARATFAPESYVRPIGFRCAQDL